MSDAELWLVRHGETEWSKDRRHTGRTDLDLTPAGEAEARALAPYVEGGRFDRVVCSPMVRARRTAVLAGLGEATADERVHEWDYGEYEGITTAEIRETVPGWSVWSHGAPGGESVGEVRARVDSFLSDVHRRGGRTIVVAHGHVLRALSARWVEAEVAFGAHLRLGTAQLCVLGHDRGVPTIERWNAVDHRRE